VPPSSPGITSEDGGKKLIEDLDDHLKEIRDRFIADTQGEDDLGVILRAHLYLESTLDGLIREFLEKPDTIELDRLQFPVKLQLAAAIGALLDEYVAPLKFLNSLRNKFAHNIGAKISESDEENLFSSMPRDDQAKISGGRNVRYTLSYLHGSLYGGLYTIRISKNSKAS
jgi:hypothetical protein